jgi:hypothetical protein
VVTWITGIPYKKKKKKILICQRGSSGEKNEVLSVRPDYGL